MYTLEIRQRRTHGPLASVSDQELIDYLALPILIGFMASTALWGSLCAQGMLYLRRHSKDVIRVKACVNHMLAAAGSGAFLYDFTWHVYHADYIPAGSETPHHARLALVVSIVRYVWIMWIRALSQSSLETWVASAMLYITVAEAAWYLNSSDNLWVPLPYIISHFSNAFAQIGRSKSKAFAVARTSITESELRVPFIER
ncbi:hypothetical protein FIBSPDRAFT_884511 [Athelia psychrophila]|uniref:Uncharacterized protein n=1 Tax=Athelia psychrophila TaxID=1759441 RepID=A0A166SUE7_9AGAM|nr:hypothetical protein FIBSPDRAFT_884511 [Fibularhizoctonia sp. CBS 109695]